MISKKGSTAEFEQNWQTRQEAKYNHWIEGKPNNQIQLAFYNHYQVFSDFLMKDGLLSGDCLEVGWGSISSHFAANGYSCTLLDSSKSVLETAKAIFRKNSHEAKFIHGDANKLPIKGNTFDIVVSIGLLEHFEDVSKPLEEQVRVLKPGGRFFGYIVPERPDNIQKYFGWLNGLLSEFSDFFGTSKETPSKHPVYRSDFGSSRYLEVVKSLPVEDIETFGMYPMPMISHSPEFPFSLLPNPYERFLVKVFNLALLFRRVIFNRNPWICREETGQAFLLTFRKK